MDIVKFSRAAAVECQRQQVGLDYVARLLEAAHIAHRRIHPPIADKLISEGLWKYIAGVAEPCNQGMYRHVPVTFANMETGIPWANVPRAMESWWGEVSFMYEKKETSIPWVDALIRNFLKIHPFVDGNGRTAWLLRVWMLNQWDNPQPLPDYFNEGHKVIGVDQAV